MITGAGLTGFCFGIIIAGVIVDKIGYGKVVVAAFIFHVVSALIAFGAAKGMSTSTAFVYLWGGSFLFAIANGTLEGVANPLDRDAVSQEPHALSQHSSRLVARGIGARRIAA